MDYVLTGVEQKDNIRVYAFVGILKGVRQPGSTVAIDVDLARQYRIPLQELPLLCVAFLQEQHVVAANASLIYGQEEMEQYVTRRADAERATAARKAHRKTMANRFPKN
jgi:hypothetical protein